MNAAPLVSKAAGGRIRDAVWVCLLLIGAEVHAQEPPAVPAAGGDSAPHAEQETLAEREEQAEAIKTDVETNENPDAGRRAEREAEPPKAARTLDYDLYGSARVHAINVWDPETGEHDSRFGDGASRVGVSGAWTFREGWDLFGRLESGFDVLDTFTPKGLTDGGKALTGRLYNIGLESDSVYVRYGKSWSTYYQVAGVADRFAIFGGDAVGIYNAATDGGATGTGRADDALQTQLYVDVNRLIGIKPFNLNVQYQQGRPVPRLDGVKYGSTWSFSAWLETEREIGVGVAWHHANIDDPAAGQALAGTGIDGDATALAVAFKTYGSRWLASLVVARLENLETTDQFKFFNGTGVELFAQWEFHQNWWLTAGGNWLAPDEDEAEAGDYEIRYTVLGLRYTLDSFHRMFYAEWRNDYGTLADGTPARNEFTIGLRWDFGY